MNGAMARHHAARVEAAIASGQAATLRARGLMAPFVPIASSRSRRNRSAPMRLSDVELRQARERVAPLLAAAQGAMDRLYQAVGASGCCVLLADGDGRAGRSPRHSGGRCDVPILGSVDRRALERGAEGTNGIGTCLVEQRALTIDRDQHFFTRNTLLSCTAVPIYDHEAAFAGVLDVSSCRADRTDAFAGLIALAAGEAARRIEADLFRAAFAHARIVLTLRPKARAADWSRSMRMIS